MEVWKQSRMLVQMVYQVAQNFPASEQYSLTQQILRASVSIPSNIAEGMGRNTSKEKARFFYISKGSLYELETQLYLALDLGFVDKKDFDKLNEQLVSVRKLIIGFIKFLQS